MKTRSEKNERRKISIKILSTMFDYETDNIF